MKLIILGAPGAGKGTQADVLSKKLLIPTISTGLIIRNEIREGTKLGNNAKANIEKGLLVPDDVVIEMTKSRLSEKDCVNGFILDGFPRTVAQAKALFEMGIDIDKVLSIELQDEEILKRLAGRRECGKCGLTYHTEYKKPEVEGVCDSCGGELNRRKDDDEETIKNRLQVYHEQTEPLKEFYDNKGKLVIAMSHEEVSDTTKEVFHALGVSG